MSSRPALRGQQVIALWMSTVIIGRQIIILRSATQTTEASLSSHLDINPHRYVRFDALVLDNASSLTDRCTGGWIYNNNQALLDRLAIHYHSAKSILGPTKMTLAQP